MQLAADEGPLAPGWRCEERADDEAEAEPRKLPIVVRHGGEVTRR